MKRLGGLTAVAVAAAVALLATPSASHDHAVHYTIDTSHSAIVFRIKHFGVSYTYGRFNGITGKFEFDKSGADSGVEITVDAATVDTFNEKRDGHLKSADFFSVKEFPKITFRSSKWEKSGNGYKVTGKLALHGVTKEVTTHMEFVGEGKGPYGKYRAGFHGTLDIKRSDYGMKEMLSGVGDDVHLMISIEGIRD